jgi:hypothetical protein
LSQPWQWKHPVGVNSDLTTFVRDKQSVTACNTCIGVRVEFSSHVVVVTSQLGRRDTKNMFHKTRNEKETKCLASWTKESPNFRSVLTSAGLDRQAAGFCCSPWTARPNCFPALETTRVSVPSSSSGGASSWVVTAATL